MRKTIGIILLGVSGYLFYTYFKNQQAIPQNVPPTPTPNEANKILPTDTSEIKKVKIKKQGIEVLNKYLESPESKEGEKKFKRSITANDVLLFTGEKQYVTLENLIPNKYGRYNNFNGNHHNRRGHYNRRNAEDTTNILAAERTQALYKRHKPTFNNTL